MMNVYIHAWKFQYFTLVKLVEVRGSAVFFYSRNKLSISSNGITCAYILVCVCVCV